MIRMVVKLWALGIYQILNIVLLNRSTNLNVLKWYQIKKFTLILYTLKKTEIKKYIPHTRHGERGLNLTVAVIIQKRSRGR